MLIRGGRAYYDEAIGILLFDGRTFPMAPGDDGNASSCDFPVRLQVVDGLTWFPPPAAQWGDTRPPEVDLVLAAARRMQRDGVCALVTCCGFFSTLQDVLAEELEIPVFTLPLILLPLLLRMISPQKKIALLIASREHMSDSLLHDAGLDDLDPRVGAETSSEFMATYMGGTRISLDVGLLEEQIVAITAAHVRHNHDVGMIVVECTTLPGFAAAIQRETGMPVVDYLGFIEFVYRSVVCREHAGFV